MADFGCQESAHLGTGVSQDQLFARFLVVRPSQPTALSADAIFERNDAAG